MTKEEYAKKLEEAKTKYGREFESKIPRPRLTKKSNFLRSLKRSQNKFD